MPYKLILSVFFIVLFYSSHSQTYFSKYSGAISSSHLAINTSDFATDVSFVEMMAGANIIAKYKMNVYSNCHFAYIQIVLSEINYPEIKTAEENYLLDYDKKIYYDLDKKTFSVYEKPDYVTTNTINSKDTVFKGIVISDGRADTALVTFNKFLPKCLTNKIILLNNLYGVQKIQTNKQLIELVEFKPTSDFDLSEKIEFAKKKCLKQIKALNYLFIN